jgi:3-hydroxy-9,10-secoandrosta-1,3,5(10)-triene-9,17-dione monooxygenase
MFSASLAKKLQGTDPEIVAEQSATFERLAQAAAMAENAKTVVLSHSQAIDQVTDPSAISDIQRTRLFRDVAYAAQQCRASGNALFEASGGSGIYDTSPLQRMWRDVNSVTAHTAFTWDSASVSYARARLGLPPAKSARR